MTVLYECFFFFQAEDGIRDGRVTGVQTCALPICRRPRADARVARGGDSRRRRVPRRRSRAPGRGGGLVGAPRHGNEGGRAQKDQTPALRRRVARSIPPSTSPWAFPAPSRHETPAGPTSVPPPWPKIVAVPTGPLKSPTESPAAAAARVSAAFPAAPG